MALSRRLRFEILRRDGYACRYCGAKAPDVEVTVDHVIPVALGGGDEPTNLVTACKDCNAGKSSMPADASTVAQITDDELRWRRAMRWARETWVVNRECETDLLNEWRAAWDDWIFNGTPRETAPMPHDWDRSVLIWVQRGMEMVDLVSLMPVAMRGPAPRSEKWIYYCGVVWRALDEITSGAETIYKNSRPPAEVV